MLKQAINHIKTMFGFRTRKQDEFDEAMSLILKTATDSRLYLAAGKPEQLDTAKGREIAHAWGEAAVKINRLNGDLREDCLSLVKTFSNSNSWGAEQVGAALGETDTMFEKACEYIRQGAKLL